MEHGDANDISSNLMASRVKGSTRQLFDTSETDHKGEPDTDFYIRPTSTRCRMGISKKLTSMMSEEGVGEAGTIGLAPEHGNITRLRLETPTTYFETFTGISGENHCVPMIIDGCTSLSLWPAGSAFWSPQALLRALGSDRRLEVAGANATVSLGDYVAYMESEGAALDDEPVYVFETLVDDDHDDIISKFCVPKFFTALSSARGCHTPIDRFDLLSAADDDGLAFGLHRWLIMGPARSGSNLHVDPLGTSAWNTLLLGRKLWVLFPPETAEADIKSAALIAFNQSTCNNTEEESSAPDSCASGWFANVLPLLDTSVAATRVQFIQKEGETVFVPAGWHHAVLNLDPSVCVTQNFASPCHYPQVSITCITCAN